MKKIFAMLMLLYMASATAGPLKIKFFFQEGCPNCAEVEPILERIQEKYGGSIEIEKISVLSSSGFEEFKRYGFEFTPSLLIGEKKLAGKEEMTYEKLTILLDSLLYGLPFRLTPLLILIAGIVSALSPATQGAVGTLLSTLARRRRSLYEALLKSLIFLFFFSFLLLLFLLILVFLLNFLFDYLYYGSVLLAFFSVACALLMLNNASTLLAYPHDFSKYRIRRIKTMIPKEIFASVSLSLFIFASGLLVMVPAFPAVVTDNFFSNDVFEGAKTSLLFCFGFFVASCTLAFVSCFFEIAESLSGSKPYSLFFSIASSILLLVYSGMVFKYALILPASTAGMVFTFVMTVLFFAFLGWAVGYWRK